MKQNSHLDDKHPFLVQLGNRVRALRNQQGMTRKSLSQSAHVSERHLANLEGGKGNVSILILLDLARALDVSMVQLLQEQASPALNRSRETPKLKLTHGKHQRIALIGLRGAGKSTLGSLLAKDLGYQFIETSREIERLAGCSLAEIYNLYGEAAYRRYERQALREIVALKDPLIIATPGGVVTHGDSFELLLTQCTTVWLQAKPMDHLSRVRLQGDHRPMASTRVTQRAAIDDLKQILQDRSEQYARADVHFDTSGYELKACYQLLSEALKLWQRKAGTE